MQRLRLLLLLAIASCAGEDDVPHIVTCFNCDPTPVPVQVFVSNASPDDGLSGLTMIYGKHPDVNGGVPVAGVRALAVPRAMPQFRVVVNKLLDGQTIEELACAGVGFTRDFATCADCRDDPGTVDNEAGRCLDRNRDTAPDTARLLGGMATIRCPGRLIYVTIPGDGYYYASGNQMASPSFGFGVLGPAIVLEPRVTLPADADCRFDLNPGVTDKDGEALVWPAGGVVFHTAEE